MMPAVKPHRMTSLVGADQEAGPDPADGCRTVIRWSGSSSSLIGTRWTACTSSGSTTATGARLAPPAEHRRDREVARRQPQLGQLARTPRPRPGRGRSPPRPRAARASTGGLAGVDRAAGERRPGRGGERMWWARSVSSRSAAVPSPSPNSISTAPRRGSASSGGRNAGQVVDGDRLGARPRPARSQSGIGRSQARTPRCSSTSSTSSLDGLDAAWRRRWPRPSASTKSEQRQAHQPGNGPAPLQVADCGSASSG